MKQRHISLTIAGICGVLLAGCDVTDNDLSGNVQEGDPVVVDLPVAYVQRPVPIEIDEDNDVPMSVEEDNIMDPTGFNPGGVLFIADRASPSAPRIAVTEGVFPPVAPDPDDPDQTPIEPLYDVRDLSTCPDGNRLVFSMRAPEIEGADDDEQPTWNIWIYDLAENNLERVIESDIVAEEGHDRFPLCLQDDSIIFSSTRQTISKGISLDQSRSRYTYVTEEDDDLRAFTLHRILDDRLTIDQLTYGKGQDLYPTLISTGKVLFLRGDDSSNRNRNRLSLYTVNPDGSDLSIYYGLHSPSSENGDDQGALVKPFELPDGRILVTFRPRETRLLGGDIVAVDAQNYTDITQPTAANLGATGPAEEVLSVGEVRLDSQSPHGYFNSAYPLNDGTERLLVSWMPCLVQAFQQGIFVRTIDVDPEPDDDIIDIRYQLIDIDGNLVDREGNTVPEGEPAVEIMFEEIVSLPCTDSTFDNEFITPSIAQFGLWTYDPVNETQSPVVFANEPGTIYTDAVVMQPSIPPQFATSDVDPTLRAELEDENVGVINIRSVYDIDGGDQLGISTIADPLQTAPDTRPVRFVRFWEEINMPHEDDIEIENDVVEGRSNREATAIIGYAQVHPDGSVMAKVPANVSLAMDFVDANGRRVTGELGAPHFNWLSVRPGEVKTCNGCHTPTSTAPHGRPDAEPESANPGALAQAQFPNTLLRDSLGTPYTTQPELGETMAEYYVRVRRTDPGYPDPMGISLDLMFTDDWTDPASGVTPAADITVRFQDPGGPGPENLLTDAPVRFTDCLDGWNARCRTIVDYPAHIQPIFEVQRFADVNGVVEDVTCLNCHTSTDADGNPVIPAPDENNLQLDFTNVISNLDDDMILLKGYDELFAAGDPLFTLDADGNLQILQEQLVINGVPQFQMVQSVDVNGIPLFEATDATGATVCVTEAAAEADPNLTLVLDGNGQSVPCLELLLDENGQPIPVLVPVEQGQYLSPNNGANSAQNQRFFAVFEEGGAHAGYLTPAELKLFAEWLDIGGQYCNEIFKAQEDQTCND